MAAMRFMCGGLFDEWLRKTIPQRRFTLAAPQQISIVTGHGIRTSFRSGRRRRAKWPLHCQPRALACCLSAVNAGLSLPAPLDVRSPSVPR